jgi:ABC-2 type transport system permease protein
MDWPAFGVLVASTAVVAAAAAGLSGRRDLFATWRPAVSLPHRLRTSPRSGPARDWSLRSAVARGVGAALGASILWAAGMGAFVVLTTALVPNARQAILDQAGGAFFDRIEKAGLASERGVLELLTFGFLPLLVTLFAVVLSAAWAQDELSGRLELEAACPQPRWLLFVQRFAANVAVLAGTLALCGAAIAVTVELSGMDVPAAVVLGGALLLLPLAALFAAVGQAMAAIRPRAAIALTGGVLAASYLAGLVLPLFNIPTVALNVSVFHLYGQPLLDGPNWAGMAVLLALTAAVLGGGAVLFERRDLVR